MPDPARLIGINHVALEVGDVDAALDLYGRLFTFSLRGRAGSMAFIDMGDQFLAVAQGRRQGPDEGRHFGLVVDDKEAVRAAVEREGLEMVPGRGLDFVDPWGRWSTTGISSSRVRPASCASWAWWGSRSARRRSTRSARAGSNESPRPR
jgi:catechol 2,3-dioxygenase-like lactoylglutathione lyase family enzyme